MYIASTDTDFVIFRTNDPKVDKDAEYCDAEAGALALLCHAHMKAAKLVCYKTACAIHTMLGGIDRNTHTSTY